MRYIFMLLPWVELFTLIKLGAETSALFSLTYVLLTFLLGIALVQYQGRGMLEHMRQAQSGGAMGPQLLLDDMATGFAGLLLIIPGVITDFLALLVAIGPLRRRLLARFTVQEENVQESAGNIRRPETIEGTFRRVDEE